MFGQLERILSSGDFDASPRSRAFFSFIVEETLAGRQHALTQSAIATRVFERRESFDPTIDPIVRIQAGRLRRSLERYYLLSGAADPVRIELPRGSYVPVASCVPSALPHGALPCAPRDLGDADGWPTVVVSLFETDGVEQALASRLKDALCVEMAHYGDVRIVRRREIEALGSGRGDFMLEGRLSADEQGHRVRAHLLDWRSATQTWAEEYHSSAGAGDTLVEDTARRIAARVASEQGMVARQLLAEQRQRPLATLTPYDAVLRSYQFFFTRDVAEFVPACEALERTVRERPECALAWVQLSRLYSANYSFELVAGKPGIDEAIAMAQTAVRLDPASQRARVALAGALLVKGELAAGLVETENAYELNPDSFVYLEWIGWLFALLGEWERGTALVRRSMDRNPNHIAVASHALWADYVRRGEFEKAYQTALLYRDPTFYWRALMRACCLGHLGRLSEARHEVAELLQGKPDFASRGRVLIGRHIKFPELAQRIGDGLARAGLKLA